MDRQMLTEYILGTMLEADRLALAERYFADDELFDQLLLVESDLLDQYVRGQLGPDKRERFERYLHRLPDHRHKVGVATALMKVVSEKQPVIPTLPTPDSWWHSILKPVQKPQVVLLYSLGIVPLISVVAVICLIIYGKQLSRENEQLQTAIAQLSARQQTLEQNAQTFEQQRTDQLARIGQLQKDLQLEQQRSTEQAQQIARLQTVSSPPPLRVELTAASRNSSIHDQVRLNPDTRSVLLIVPMEGRKKYSNYRVVIRTTDGEPVWEKYSAQPPRVGKGIILRLATSQLPPGSYKLTLILNTADGTEIASDYYFAVVKQ
jgi:hypothetical protein